MEMRTPEIIDVSPFSNKDNYPKKQVNKKAAVIGILFAISVLAMTSYFINIGFLHIFGAIITCCACAYSIYNINKVNIK